MRNWGDDHEPHDPVLAKDWRHALECLHFAASVQGVALQPTALRAALAGGTLKFLDLARLARQWGCAAGSALSVMTRIGIYDYLPCCNYRIGDINCWSGWTVPRP